MELILGYFHLDRLSALLIAVTGLIGITVISFSKRYLRGNSNYKRTQILNILLVSTMFLMAISDNILLFWAAWLVSNLTLAELVIHKRAWKAAHESGKLARRRLSLGSFLLALGLGSLSFATGYWKISMITQSPINSMLFYLGSVLLVLSALIQSAIFPFHKWLLSSCNSPTPTSALMHAGIVNGGGYLLCRFASVISKTPDLMSLLFLVGSLTACLGTLWKLIQSDIKRMLACSTIGQMGFMIAQCALGLFPAALAHLTCHGFFKAYLFLSSGSAAKDLKKDQPIRLNCFNLILSIIFGCLTNFLFSKTLGLNFFSEDTKLFMNFIAILGGTTISLHVLRSLALKQILVAFLLSGCSGLFYGLSIGFIETLVTPSIHFMPQPLNWIHYLVLIIFSFNWFFVITYQTFAERTIQPIWLKEWYVNMLNFSQPSKETITAIRKNYQF